MPSRGSLRTLAAALGGLLLMAGSPVVASAGPPAFAGPAPVPGQLISVEPLPGPQTIPGASQSLRIVYWTADGAGQPRTSSAALYLPDSPARSVVSWAHGANGLGDHCAPTALGRPERESDYFRTLLADDFAVVATDYIGLGTPGPPAFLDASGEANAVSDAVRAAHHVDPTLNSWIADGHSQGAHATLNAAADGPARVPELRYLGAAATSIPPQVDKLFPQLTPTTPAVPIDVSGLYLMALRGFATTYPDLRIDRHLSPLGAQLFGQIDSRCVDAINLLTKDVSIGQLLRSRLTTTETRSFESYLRLPVSGIAKPLFVGSGYRDQILPFPTVLPVIAQLRSNGVDVQFQGYDAGHDDIINVSRSQRLAFLRGLTTR